MTSIVSGTLYGGLGNQLFMVAADDMIFNTVGWDKDLIQHYENLENKIHVYHLQDSRDIDGTPHPIMSREYIEATGYFVPPIFLHWEIDSGHVRAQTLYRFHYEP